MQMIAKFGWRFCREKLDSGKVWSDSLSFIDGVFFEILVSIIISISLTKDWDLLN